MKKLVGKFDKLINEARKDIKNYPLIFIICGIPFLILGVCFIVWNINFMNRSVATEGIVVDERIVHAQLDYESDDYIPIVEFRTNEGQLVTFDGEVWVSIGQKVRVRYTPSNPSDARIYSVFNFWVGWAIITVGSAVLLSVGLRSWLNRFKSRKQSRINRQN